MKKEKTEKRPKQHQRSKKLSWTLLLFVLMSGSALAFGNWFAHQPTEVRARFGVCESFCESLGLLTANFTDQLGLTGTDASIVYVGPVNEGPLPFGAPKVIDTLRLPTDQQMHYYKGFWVAWSPSLKIPLWSAYAVPTKKVMDHAEDRPSRFKCDKMTKNASRHEDYTKTGYDRGHMAPNHVIATRYGREAQIETFFMSNIAPQKPDLNRHAWRTLEEKVANDLSQLGEKLWVITGIVPGASTSLLAKGGIHIPKGFYKVIYSIREGKLYTLGVYMPQETSSKKHPRFCFRSIDAIEAMSGMDFFTDLPEARQAALESIEPTRFWAKGLFD